MEKLKKTAYKIQELLYKSIYPDWDTIGTTVKQVAQADFEKHFSVLSERKKNTCVQRARNIAKGKDTI